MRLKIINYILKVLSHFFISILIANSLWIIVIFFISVAIKICYKCYNKSSELISLQPKIKVPSTSAILTPIDPSIVDYSISNANQFGKEESKHESMSYRRKPESHFTKYIYPEAKVIRPANSKRIYLRD